MYLSIAALTLSAAALKATFRRLTPNPPLRRLSSLRLKWLRAEGPVGLNLLDPELRLAQLALAMFFEGHATLIGFDSAFEAGIAGLKPLHDSFELAKGDFEIDLAEIGSFICFAHGSPRIISALVEGKRRRICQAAISAATCVATLEARAFRS